MRIAINIRASRASLTALLTGLVLVNVEQLAVLNLPPLYQSGVRYVRERGREQWQTAAETMSVGHGDCEDLASWRAAELRREGIAAMAVAIRTGPRLYHAVVRHPDGSIEDPSRRLGMRGRG